MKLKSLLIAAFLFAASFAASAQRYCNPLPMPVGQGGNAGGDVSVIEEGGKYYMYCSGGGAWVSSDLLNWEFHYVANVPVAPDVVKYNGKFYMTGNSKYIFVADNPLGPFESIGEFKNTGPIEDGWVLEGFDTKIYIDDDNQPYLFWPGRGISGIYGVKLDPNDISRFMEKPTHLFGFNPMHSWERYGEANEYPTVAWIEGPWIIKRNGVYYLEYSASGTQWITYAEGYYTATSPLGPYTYASNNPLLRKVEGLVTGTAHGSIVKGPDDNWWQFYTIVLSSGGRRIGMDKVTFDEDGLMYCTVTDTPQPAPLAKAAKAKKSLPVTSRKIGISDSKSKVSSEQDGYFGVFAADNTSKTVWRPKADDVQPSFTIDLGPATQFDVKQLFMVDSFRVLFAPAGRGFGVQQTLPVYKYKCEVSMDGENFTTVLDKTNNTESRDTIFEEFAPVEARIVRFTITDWPKNGPLGVIDFTAFGIPSGWLPADAASPAFTNLPPNTRGWFE